jgi:hypothetical protein
VFSWSGTLAVRIWDRGAAALNQHLFRVVERPGVVRLWLRYAIESKLPELSGMSHGTTSVGLRCRPSQINFGSPTSWQRSTRRSRTRRRG